MTSHSGGTEAEQAVLCLFKKGSHPITGSILMTEAPPSTILDTQSGAPGISWLRADCAFRCAFLSGFAVCSERLLSGLQSLYLSGWIPSSSLTLDDSLSLSVPQIHHL